MHHSLSYVLAIIVFISCNSVKQPGNSDEAADDNIPDTAKPVITSTLVATAYPGIFETAFHSDTKVIQGDMRYKFYRLEIGDLKIESGKIIASDFVVLRDASPFTQVFPIGQFPVQLAMAKTDDDLRVAFSKILFSSERVIKWEVALQEGQKSIPLKDSSLYCYGVDAGTGLFIDSIACSVFVKKQEAEWDEVFITKAEQNGYKGFIHDFDGHNLATFSTGYGDGCYATFIGYDKQGNVCQLLTDFGLVAWWRLEEK